MPAHTPPTIDTPRLTLRPMGEDDVDLLLPLFTDPTVMSSFGGVLFTRSQMRQWVRRNLEHQEQYGYGLFSIILKDDGQLIGDCGLEHMELDGRLEAELGYDLRADYWGRGYATEAAAAVRDYAFATLHLPRLVSLIRQTNERSQRVAERIGMHRSTALHRYDVDYWIYAIDRPTANGA